MAVLFIKAYYKSNYDNCIYEYVWPAEFIKHGEKQIIALLRRECGRNIKILYIEKAKPLWTEPDYSFFYGIYYWSHSFAIIRDFVYDLVLPYEERQNIILNIIKRHDDEWELLTQNE